MSEQTMIGPYEVLDQVGSGGMATVYRAYQPKLDRYVALKVMHKSMLQDASFLARFEREARIVARLEHPNIVPIYDYDEYDGQPYLVMKFIEGQTLKDLLNNKVLSLDEIRDLMGTVADALTFAHEQGVLHRDIKPSNIIIDSEGTPYLTDFGLARIAQQGESTLSADMMLGTPHYISPEQAQGSPEIDARTDVYSLGVLLYELVTGRLPFTADSPYAIVHKHIYQAPPPPSQLNSDVTPSVERVLLQALEKEPSQRPATPRQLIADFEMALTASGLHELKDDRSIHAEAAAYHIPQHTPGGGKYVSVPAPVPGQSVSTPVSDIMQEFGQRIKLTLQDVHRELQERGVIDDVKQTANEVVGEIRSAIDETPRRHVKGKHRRLVAVDDEWGTDEASIRWRVRRRLALRRGLVFHVILYVIVIAGLAAIADTALIKGLAEARLDPDVAQAISDVGADFLTPLERLNIALTVALLWGSGIFNHALSVFYNSGGRLERKRRAVEQDMRNIYGPDWTAVADPQDYRRIRREVNSRFKQRLNFISHFVTSLFLILAAQIVWGPISDMLTIVGQRYSEAGEVAAFPVVPVFALLMMVTLVFHAIGLGIGAVTGQDRRERTLQREIVRERSMISSKAKRDDKRKNISLDELNTEPEVRLTGDGEFTESFIQEIEDDHQR